MTWAKLDDQYFRHPKSRAAGKDGRALDLAAICYSSSALTDGFISKDALPLIAAEAGVRPTVARKLVEVGRWDDAIGGYQIHNYETRQRTRAEVDAEREATRDRVKRHRDKRRSNGVTSIVGNGVGNNEVTASEVDTETDTDHPLQPCSEPPAVENLDDDTRSATPTIDPAAITIRAVLDRCTDARMTTAQPRNRPAYRATVFAEFQARSGELAAVIATHPGAPVDVLAGWLLDEPNTLHAYRESA